MWLYIDIDAVTIRQQNGQERQTTLARVHPLNSAAKAQELRITQSQDHVTYESFTRIWKEEFPEVKIPPQQRLGKCQVCKTLHDKILQTRDPQKLAALKKERMAHLKLVRADRLVYHTWRRESRLHPEQFLTIILDGTLANHEHVPAVNVCCIYVQAWTRIKPISQTWVHLIRLCG
jgi:hypothetical protein